MKSLRLNAARYLRRIYKNIVTIQRTLSFRSETRNLKGRISLRFLPLVEKTEEIGTFL